MHGFTICTIPLTSLIKTVFMDQLSFLGINPQIKTLILLNFLRKQEPMLTIQSIYVREAVKRLLVPQNITTFFTDKGINRFMTHQSIISACPPLIPEFNPFNVSKTSPPYFQISRKTCYLGIS